MLVPHSAVGGSLWLKAVQFGRKPLAETGFKGTRISPRKRHVAGISDPGKVWRAGKQSKK